MSNIHTEQTLEQIHEQVLEDDAKLLLTEEIDEICEMAVNRRKKKWELHVVEKEIINISLYQYNMDKISQR